MSKSITLEDLQRKIEAIENLKPTVYINQNTYNQLTDLMDFKEIKVVIHSDLEDNNAIIVDDLLGYLFIK